MIKRNFHFAILGIGILLLAISLTFPPWFYENGFSGEIPAGYHFIFSSPQIKSQEEMRKLFSIKEKDPYDYNFYVHIDLGFLIAQNIFIVGCTIAAFLFVVSFKPNLNLQLRILSICFSFASLIGGSVLFAIAIFFRYGYLLDSYYTPKW